MATRSCAERALARSSVHADEEAFAQRCDPTNQGLVASLRGAGSSASSGRMGSGLGAGDCRPYRGAGAVRARCHSDKSAITAKWSDGHTPLTGAFPPSRTVSIRPRSCCGNPTNT